MNNEETNQNNPKNLLWCEKYRPSTVEGCILPKHIKDIFLNFVTNKEFPNLLLSGTSGTGKTTSALALLNELGYSYLFINASEERNLDTVRTRISDFCSSMSIENKPKAVILDESDGFLSTSQSAMRGVIEEYPHIRFIFTCNYKNKIIPAIQSRTTNIDFSMSKKDKETTTLLFCKRVFEILEQETVTFDKKVVASVVKNHYPDNRRILNELQKYAIGGVIDVGILTFDMKTNLNDLVEMLKSNNKKFEDIREWIVKNSSMDINDFFKELYDFVYDKLDPETKPDFILLMADYQFKSAFVVNQEINLSAFLLECMRTLKWK